jgi:hypothetical protein
VESFLCEKPERHAPRRLSDYLVLEGQTQKVHSLWTALSASHLLSGSGKPIRESRVRNVARVDMWRPAPKLAAQAGWQLLNAT